MPNTHRVVILGGGFGGLYAARTLKRAPVQVTLVDRRNFHLFQPLLYQVATGGLSPANIATPLRKILKRQRNARVLLGEATGLDPLGRRVILSDGDLSYDTLVVALGSSHHYFGKDGWSRLAPGLKTIEDAIEIRRRILIAFERAERASDQGRIRSLLTFVVVGGGPTGVELAGALAEIARDTLSHEFRSIDPSHARILLVEGSPRVLSAYPPDLSEKAVRSLRRLGVEVRTGGVVTDIQPDAIVMRSGEQTERIPAATVLWGAGVQASPFSKVLAETAGATLDRAGRVDVEPDLSLPGHPEILVIGDQARFAHELDSPLPGVAQVAMQQGAYAARLIRNRLRGRTTPPFRYRDYGTMATIGRHAAVADICGVRFAGYVAWLAWLCIHLVQLVQFENRLLVFAQWAWNYFTFNRAARLITNLPTADRQDDKKGN
ncbi:MAG: FAD-dependent oxidoreductase [candidate division NC10 bacterium]|nr:FAD-dependent oxidoreductase [candidate division NC10 bacterium]